MESASSSAEAKLEYNHSESASKPASDERSASAGSTSVFTPSLQPSKPSVSPRNSMTLVDVSDKENASKGPPHPFFSMTSNYWQRFGLLL